MNDKGEQVRIIAYLLFLCFYGGFYIWEWVNLCSDFLPKSINLLAKPHTIWQKRNHLAKNPIQ